MTSQAWQRAFNVAGAMLIVAGAIWFIATFFAFGTLYPNAAIFRAHAAAALSPMFLLVLGYTFIVSAGLYVSGWAIWWRRRWGPMVVFVTLFLLFAIGFVLVWFRYPVIWLAVVSFLTHPFILGTLALLLTPIGVLVACGRNWRTATNDTNGSAPREGARRRGDWLAWIVAALAIVFLATATVFFRLGSPGAVLTVLAFSALLTAFLVLSGWRPWNRVLGTILVGAALCALLATFVFGARGLSGLAPLSQIPFLASAGLLYMASSGASLETLVMGILEAVIPGTALLLLFGIPFTVSPARVMPRGAVGSLAAHRAPVLASVLAIVLAVPLFLEWRFARELPSSTPAAPAMAPLAKAPPPPPPPPPPRTSTEPLTQRAVPQGPVGAAAGSRIAPSPAPRAASEPTRVASTSLKIVKRVAPRFPQESGKSGTVILEIVIGPDGQVVSARALKGDRELAQAAISAVKEWRFEPYVVGGEPTSVKTALTFAFKGE